MKLEVYPTYADQINEIVRRDRSKRGLWADVIKLAARLMDVEDGRRNAYPRAPEGRPDEEPGVREALRKIRLGSARARWVFLSVAAREILRREKQLLVLGVLVALLAITIAPATAAAPAGVVVFASPQQVNRFDSFLVTVKMDQPNTSFNLTIAGRNGFFLLYQNRTDPAGLYVQNVSAYFDFGQYEVDASIANATSRVFVTVGCDAACEVDILHQNGLLLQQLLYAEIEKWGLYVLLGVLALEGPRVLMYFRQIAKRARERGSFTPREAMAAPVVMLRGHFNPGDNVADPKNPQNPRIQIDGDRRELMEQLHAATSKPYMEWNPDHLDAIEDVFRDLKKVWARQREALPAGAPHARTYSRPPPEMKSQGATYETEARSPPIVGPESTSQLNDAGPRTSEIPPPPNGRNEMKPTESKKSKRVSSRAIVLVVVGLPAGVMALLVLLAYQGVYVDVLRPLWSPWPPDVWKVVIGVVAFTITLAAWAAPRLAPWFARKHAET